jgi:phosphatidylglycerol---prolipoprotein diacylglyceryl transferase
VGGHATRTPGAMHPTLTFAVAGPGLWASLLALAAFAGGAAIASRRASSEPTRIGALFVAYALVAAGLAIGISRARGVASLSVSAYAAWLTAGAVAAWALLLVRLSRLGYPLRVIFYIVAGCLVFGIVGARAAQLGEDLLAGSPSSYGWAEAASVHRGGLGVFGALLANGLFLHVLFRLLSRSAAADLRPGGEDLGLAATLDAGISAVAVNLAAGRIGCLLAGCCFGSLTSAGSPLSLSVHAFDSASPAGIHYVGAGDEARIWATQPFEAAVALAIAGSCELLYRARARLRLAPGAVAAVAALAYSVARSLLEHLRDDSPRPVLGTFTVWQTLSLAGACASLVWLRLRGRSHPRIPS